MTTSMQTAEKEVEGSSRRVPDETGNESWEVTDGPNVQD
jgi:hypothetical protein